MNPLENNKQMVMDRVQPDGILQTCRQARLETAQTTFGRPVRKLPLLVNREGEPGTVGHLRLKRMEQQVSPEADKEERPP